MDVLLEGREHSASEGLRLQSAEHLSEITIAVIHRGVVDELDEAVLDEGRIGGALLILSTNFTDCQLRDSTDVG